MERKIHITNKLKARAILISEQKKEMDVLLDHYTDFIEINLLIKRHTCELMELRVTDQDEWMQLLHKQREELGSFVNYKPESSLTFVQ
ncbi:hypothetical protein [Dyadobacter sp. NIV53]|uniref:hypothetical protein n=1 Tax=Dyadobacter sp. NIV53 TaxID=2861765 RepID=UPI001C883234|nr:hypothetical protein [Dyadobacter sp. NIV53]